MARTGRVRNEGDGHYHVMSRTNAKAFLFKSGRMKTKFVDLLQRSAAFSGIGLDAYTIMDNHFHAVVTVVKPDEPVGEAEILKRIAILKSEKAADAVAAHFASLRTRGLSLELENALNGWRRRMHDVSEFVKTFKELVNIHYKKTNEHCGSIFAGRFYSTVVEGGKYWATVRRYVELNAVRAKIVGQSKDYAWCSHATTTAEPASRYVVIAGKVFAAGSVPAAGAGGRGSSPSAVELERDPPIGAEMLRNSLPAAGSDAQSDIVGTDPACGALGTDPAWEVRILKRVVQIGAGKIFGSRAFVEATVGANARALPRGARAWQISEGFFATHGWKLAKEAELAA